MKIERKNSPSNSKDTMLGIQRVYIVILLENCNILITKFYSLTDDNRLTQPQISCILYNIPYRNIRTILHPLTA